MTKKNTDCYLAPDSGGNTFIHCPLLPDGTANTFMKVLPLPANVGRQSVFFWDGIHGGKYRPIPYLIMVTEPLMAARPLLGLMM